MIEAVAGLGNPDDHYRDTRHNAGFWLVDALAAQSGIAWKQRSRFGVWLGEGRFRGHRLILIKPALYMNNSGPPVRRVLDYFGLVPAGLLVVLDDVSLPPGRLRLRPGGGAGGHRGLESVIDSLGTLDFPRLRIGIGGSDRPDLIGHVLARVGREEEETYRRAVGLAVEAVEDILRSGLETAMNRYNPAPVEGAEEQEKGGSH